MKSDFYTLVEKRQSCRDYDASREVEEAKIRRILEAGRLAPSACNSQPWHLIAVTQPALMKDLAEALTSMGMNRWASQARAFIVIVQEQPNFTARLGGWIKNKHFPLIDCGIVASHITLAATQEGLGSCILGWFDEKRVKRMFAIPRSRRVLMVVSLGYTNEEHRAHNRRDIESVASFNHYQ